MQLRITRYADSSHSHSKKEFATPSTILRRSAIVKEPASLTTMTASSSASLGYLQLSRAQSRNLSVSEKFKADSPLLQRHAMSKTADLIGKT